MEEIAQTMDDVDYPSLTKGVMVRVLATVDPLKERSISLVISSTMAIRLQQNKKKFC